MSVETSVQDVTRIDTLPYPITIAPGLLDAAGEIARTVAPAHRYAIVTDSTVGPLYAERVAGQLRDAGKETHTFTFPAGEPYKTRVTWALLTDQMLSAGFGRDSAVIALGGGVVGDLAGFVAATFMRGIPFVQVPTTLLAMIDASIGGKTGVDTPAGKNLVGAFHLPAAVVIDPRVLDTLPASELRGGLAEAIKHGAIADEAYFTMLAEAPALLLGSTPGTPGTQSDDGRAFTTRLIARSVQIKADVVARDEREQGVRKILNFGHTVGHAIELLSGFAMSHGEAVAAGMVIEADAGERAGVTESGTADRLRELLRRVELPMARPAGPSPDEILAVMRGDKKSRAGSVEYAVPRRIGVMAGAEAGYGVRLEDTLVRDVLA